VNFTKVVTDYGLCYTFNSEQELYTSKTGLSACCSLSTVTE